MKDLPKFIDALRSLAKSDASLQVTTNQETGEALLAGMGELHLEITVYRIEEEQNIKGKCQSSNCCLSRRYPRKQPWTRI